MSMPPHHYKDGYCGRCGYEWPCPAAQLAPRDRIIKNWKGAVFGHGPAPKRPPRKAHG